jgi:hypothetical protein
MSCPHALPALPIGMLHHQSPAESSQRSESISGLPAVSLARTPVCPSTEGRKQYQYYYKQCKPALATATIATKPAWAPAKHSTGCTGRSLHVLACPWRQATLARSCHNVSTCLCQAARYHGITSECPALEIKMCMTTAIIGSHVVRLMDPLVSIPVVVEPAFLFQRGKTGTGRIWS